MQAYPYRTLLWLSQFQGARMLKIGDAAHVISGRRHLYVNQTTIQSMVQAAFVQEHVIGPDIVEYTVTETGHQKAARLEEDRKLFHQLHLFELEFEPDEAEQGELWT